MENSILNKVCFLLDKAKSKNYSKNDLKTIIEFQTTLYLDVFLDIQSELMLWLLLIGLMIQ